MKRTLTISITTVLIVSSAGCLTGPADESVVGFDGTVNVSDGEFSMTGDVVYVKNNDAGPETFENVSVHLYRQNKTLIREESIGSLQTRANIDIGASTIPSYVIVYSPEFWERSDLQVEYFTRLPAEKEEEAPGEYTVKKANEAGQLPILPVSSNQTKGNVDG